MIALCSVRSRSTQPGSHRTSRSSDWNSRRCKSAIFAEKVVLPPPEHPITRTRSTVAKRLAASIRETYRGIEASSCRTWTNMLGMPASQRRKPTKSQWCKRKWLHSAGAGVKAWMRSLFVAQCSSPRLWHGYDPSIRRNCSDRSNFGKPLDCVLVLPADGGFPCG